MASVRQEKPRTTHRSSGAGALHLQRRGAGRRAWLAYHRVGAMVGQGGGEADVAYRQARDLASAHRSSRGHPPTHRLPGKWRPERASPKRHSAHDAGTGVDVPRTANAGKGPRTLAVGRTSLSSPPPAPIRATREEGCGREEQRHKSPPAVLERSLNTYRVLFGLGPCGLGLSPSEA